MTKKVSECQTETVQFMSFEKVSLTKIVLNILKNIFISTIYRVITE